MSERPLITIVDDEPTTCELLAGALEGRYRVQAFGHGQALLDSLATQAVDLVLLDVEMPGLDGYQTCRALRAGPVQADVPVIFLSAHSLLEERLQGYAAGGNDYLTKPFDIDELNAKILNAIDAHRRTRQLAREAADMGEAAAVTAEMMGEIGVVLDFQRSIADCHAPGQIATALLDALARFGLDGCLRLQTRRGTVSRSSAGALSALETSLLQHLESRPDTRIVTMGTNLGFAYGAATVLVRSVAWALAASDPATLDAMGRARDNVALLVEGALSRLHALDAEADAQHLVLAQRLIDMTRQALHDLEQSARQVHDDLDAVFEHSRADFEYLFPLLGLSHEQEDRLLAIVTQQRASGLEVLARSRQAEQGLRRLLDRLADAQAATPPRSGP
jgi:DNA-binding response OmpR family regulator